MDAPNQILDALLQEGESELDRLIALAEETPFLDFKRMSRPDDDAEPTQDDLRNYSRALSGFANSAGGLLVWGVGEVGARGARLLSKMPIANPELFRQKLDHLLPMMVSRPIENVRNVVVAARDGQQRGFVVTYVPESADAPHRAEGREKQYFRRVGSNFVAMAHYEIEDMFGRRQRPNLSLELCFAKHASSSNDLHQYNLRANILNSGRAMARFYRASMKLPAIACYWPGDRISIDRSGSVNLVHVSNPSQPLFPGDKCQAAFNAFTYHMNLALLDKFEIEGYPDLDIELFADGSRPQRISHAPWSRQYLRLRLDCRPQGVS